MCQKRFEASFMRSGQMEDGISSVACSHRTGMFGIGPRLFAGGIEGSKQILLVLLTVIL